MRPIQHKHLLQGAEPDMGKKMGKKMTALKKKNYWVAPSNFYSYHNIDMDYNRRKENSCKGRVVRADTYRGSACRQDVKAPGA
jgi:hypothetical protein